MHGNGRNVGKGNLFYKTHGDGSNLLVSTRVEIHVIYSSDLNIESLSGQLDPLGSEDS